MVVQHLKIHWMIRPEICALGVIAGLGTGDLWFVVAGLLAAWFVDARCWDPYLDERKPDKTRS